MPITWWYQKISLDIPGLETHFSLAGLSFPINNETLYTAKESPEFIQENVKGR